jgi:hypothetical protein
MAPVGYKGAVTGEEKERRHKYPPSILLAYGRQPRYVSTRGINSPPVQLSFVHRSGSVALPYNVPEQESVS